MLKLCCYFPCCFLSIQKHCCVALFFLLRLLQFLLETLLLFGRIFQVALALLDILLKLACPVIALLDFALEFLMPPLGLPLLCFKRVRGRIGIVQGKPQFRNLLVLRPDLFLEILKLYRNGVLYAAVTCISACGLRVLTSPQRQNSVVAVLALTTEPVACCRICVRDGLARRPRLRL